MKPVLDDVAHNLEIEVTVSIKRQDGWSDAEVWGRETRSKKGSFALSKVHDEVVNMVELVRNCALDGFHTTVALVRKQQAKAEE